MPLPQHFELIGQLEAAVLSADRMIDHWRRISESLLEGECLDHNSVEAHKSPVNFDLAVRVLVDYCVKFPVAFQIVELRSLGASLGSLLSEIISRWHVALTYHKSQVLDEHTEHGR